MTESLNIKSGKVVGIKTSIFTIFNSEKYDPTAIPTAWGDFFKKAAGTDLLSSDTYYGVSIPSMSMDTPMDYFAGALVDDSFDVPSAFESVSLPGGEYLTIEHLGPITNIASAYQKAYMDVSRKSGKEMRSAPHLEIYNSQLDPMSADYKMLIAVPVQS